MSVFWCKNLKFCVFWCQKISAFFVSAENGAGVDKMTNITYGYGRSLSLSSFPLISSNENLEVDPSVCEHFPKKTFLKAEAKHRDTLVLDINPFVQNR